MNRVLLMRHGENRANLTKEFSYQSVDYPLNAKGRLQARQTGEHLQGHPIQAIYSSPLLRAVETAQIVGEILGITPIIEEDFRELNVGDLESRPPNEETWAAYRRVIRAWVEGHPETAFPGGEDYPTLWTRYERGLRKAIQAHPGQELLIVAHGGNFTLTMPTLCPGVNILDLFRAESQNASLTTIELIEEQGNLTGRLLEWASTDHLSGKAADLIPGTPHKGDLPPVDK